MQIESSCIFIHAANLNFTNVTLQYNESSPLLIPVSINYDPINQWQILTFENDLELGDAVLNISFAGFINTQNATGDRSTN